MKTWGCSHNNSDGEYMAGQLAASGYKITGKYMVSLYFGCFVYFFGNMLVRVSKNQMKCNFMWIIYPVGLMQWLLFNTGGQYCSFG